MISSIKDKKQLAKLVSNIVFNKVTAGDIILVTDAVKLPVFEFNHSGEFQKQEVMDSCELFINVYLDKVNELFFNIDEYSVKQFSFNPEQIKEKFLELVSELCERSGTYKSTYDLMYQLTHYVSSMNVIVRVGMKQEGDYLIPLFVASLTMDARNKLDKALNKTLELDTIKLNS